MSNQEKVVNQELQENRKKLQERMAQAGKPGNNVARRKHKAIHKETINDDKKLKQVIKRYGVQPLQAIDEVNFFKDDNTIMHFKKPEVHAAFQSHSFAIFGNPETKTFKELMPDIMQQIGPKQLPLLQEMMASQLQRNPNDKIQESDAKDEEDVPELVGGENFEELSKHEQ
ncbi:hypothetical protein pb186bvf_003497 [Paramecium bursaria]